MISSVGDMVRNADPNAVKIDEKLDEVKVYLRWHKFKPELALRVRRYYEFYFSRSARGRTSSTRSHSGVPH